MERVLFLSRAIPIPKQSQGFASFKWFVPLWGSNQFVQLLSGMFVEFELKSKVLTVVHSAFLHLISCIQIESASIYF